MIKIINQEEIRKLLASHLNDNYDDFTNLKAEDIQICIMDGNDNDAVQLIGNYSIQARIEAADYFG